MKNGGYMSLRSLWSCSIVQYSSLLLMKFGREVRLLCHFMSQSSPKWLFLCQELRRRKGKKRKKEKAQSQDGKRQETLEILFHMQQNV